MAALVRNVYCKTIWLVCSLCFMSFHLRAICSLNNIQSIMPRKLLVIGIPLLYIKYN